MKCAVGSARSVLAPAPTAICVVKFKQKPRRAPQRKQPPLEGRVPRVARFLALAHRIDGMIRAGELRDWAEAARLVGVTRARMTQIGNLTILAPALQELILFLDLRSAPQDQSALPERALRRTSALSDWNEQVQAVTSILRAFMISLPKMCFPRVRT